MIEEFPTVRIREGGEGADKISFHYGSREEPSLCPYFPCRDGLEGEPKVANLRLSANSAGTA